MEEVDQNGINLGNGPGGSRWNPTKDQISALENLYRQGLRTPSAEQIQQITARLKTFGHIEGKNVFYWFQNHKARQRQKQKQENFACFNRFLHAAAAAASPVFPQYQNVLCSPCYPPPPSPPMLPLQNELGFFRRCPKVPQASAAAASAAGFKRRLVNPTNHEYRTMPHHPRIKDDEPSHATATPRNSSSYAHQETLDLFPIHPTGILQSRNSSAEAENEAGSSNSSENEYCNINDVIISCNDEEEEGRNVHDHPYFDFFCKK